MINKYLKNLYVRAADLNQKNIFSLFEKNNEATFLDLGCDDGMLTIRMAEKIGTKNIFGVEIIGERIELAVKNGIAVKNFDLNKVFDFQDNTIDVICANQVIEHIHDSDNFISEIYRILKPNGYAIVSTENASSWCNIFASIMGWQIFSLTNISNKKSGIGNPFALHKNHERGLPINLSPNNIDVSSWNHIRIYNIRGLKEYFEVFGFKIEEMKGSGYFPLPAKMGNIDKTHCHFMTFKIRK